MGWVWLGRAVLYFSGGNYYKPRNKLCTYTCWSLGMIRIRLRTRSCTGKFLCHPQVSRPFNTFTRWSDLRQFLHARIVNYSWNASPEFGVQTCQYKLPPLIFFFFKIFKCKFRKDRSVTRTIRRTDASDYKNIADRAAKASLRYIRTGSSAHEHSQDLRLWSLFLDWQR